jgi:hypothetical protein
VVGFGWTNGVYLKMRELLTADATSGPCAAAPVPATAGAR